MTSVVIAYVGGYPAARPLSQALAHRLRRVGVVVITCGLTGSGAESSRSVSSAVRRLLGSGNVRPTLVLIGDETAQRRLVWGLALAGLLPAVRLVVHASAARVPYETLLADVFARADIVAAESKLGAQAVRLCCEEAGEPAPEVVVVPPELPSGTNLSGPHAAERRALRRARLGVEDEAVVVGCWTGDGPEEAVPLALRIFQLFARGHYLRCEDCGHVTPWSEDDELRPVPYDHCARCGSASGEVGRARDDAQLLLVGEPPVEDDLWRTRAVGRYLGLAGPIVHEPTPRSPHDLVRLWDCVDVHLQPHVLADVPASVRMSCVLGVPIIATGHGAIEERLAGAASLVPPRIVLDHSDGHRIALMDPGGALVELCHLADDRAARRLAGARLRELSRSWEASGRLDRWAELLDIQFAS